NVALSRLLGSRVLDANGAVAGRVREVAISPQEDPNRISALIVRTKTGDRLVPANAVCLSRDSLFHCTGDPNTWPTVDKPDELFLLERDLLDQQIIDVHGRKVVRVNDVDLHHESGASLKLKVGEVDVGTRGAVRRLLRSVIPQNAVERLVEKLPTKVIPWEFVDLIETDPSRRVKLKIEHERLSRLHPADIADILEELAPAEREAVFESLDEHVAAETIEEIDPKMQVSIMKSLDSEHAADIVEEMDPDAAADLLGDLPQETSDEILEEMEPEEREEVEELLEHREDTAAGRMTTDYLAASPDATVSDAIDLLRNFEGGVESVSTVYLVEGNHRLVGAVPLARLALSPPEWTLGGLTVEPPVSCSEKTKDWEVAELFDKYNLFTLPVVDDEGRLTGVITADDVINMLRER
ncbi:MAG TPA: CBS domain-containing protein, partial [Terriglobales bacterium]